MVSVFPSLLAWSEFSPLLIRLTLAAILFFWAKRAFASHNNVDGYNLTQTQAKILAIKESVLAVLLIIGLWTQVAALIVLIDLVIRIASKIKRKQFLSDGVNYYLIILVLAISLLVTGSGALSFDYPL